mmetsp:Transcript_13594/g.17916  ORF Transcript_13594/g.17916 Transcript_13594/m.17916 type:complete len:274 (-) Transcript_13594:372-1193(-)
MMRPNRNNIPKASEKEERTSDPDLELRSKRVQEKTKYIKQKNKSAMPVFSLVGLFLVACALFLFRREAGVETRRSKRQQGQRTDKFKGFHWNTQQTVESRLMVSTPHASCELHTVTAEDGTLVNDWLWWDTFDQINIIVQLANEEKFLLFRKNRYGLESTSLAPIDGEIELNEQPEAAVHRLLKSKADLSSNNIISLGRRRVNANHGGGYLHSFLALGATQLSGDAKIEDLPPGATILKKDALGQSVLNGDVLDVHWASSILLAVNWMDSSSH